MNYRVLKNDGDRTWTAPRTGWLAGWVLITVMAGAGSSLAQSPGEQGVTSRGAVVSEEEHRGEAIFAGGCFWCMESAFDHLEGVEATISGYTGGKLPNPTYEAVKHGRTGHYEALKVVYDRREIDYEKLLDHFWRNIDPFNPRGQFCDTGSQYRAAIFVEGDSQRKAAEASMEELAKYTKLKIVTQILSAETFYPAEAYHQDYYLKNPIKYRYYRSSCGRDQRLVEIWGAQAGGNHH